MTDPKGTNWYTHTASGINMWTGTIPWQQSSYLLNLNSVAIDTIQFRFIFYSNASTNAFGGWAIDDFEISLPQVAIDGGITVITSPAGSAQIGAAVSVSATIKNFGTSPLTSIPLSYTLGLGNPVNEVYIPSGNGLAPGASDTYNFNTSFMAPSNDFALCVSTHIIGDIYANNDKHCETIAVSPANIDIAVIGVKANPSWHDTTKVSYATTISVTIVNKGLNTVTSIPLEAKVASSVINDTWTGIMNHNDTITYTFTQTYNSPMGTYTLSGESKLANDANATNNRVSKVYVGILDIGGIGNGDNDGFSVSQNIPNPASGLTLINYYIPNSGKVKFELSNSMGQSVMVSETSELAGENSITIDANSLSAGVYYFSIQYDDYTITKKMVVSK
jgi:hypothetical protein